MYIIRGTIVNATRNMAPQIHGARSHCGDRRWVPIQVSQSYFFQARRKAGFFMSRDGRYIARAMDGAVRRPGSDVVGNTTVGWVWLVA